MYVLQAIGQILLLLIPLAVMAFVFVLVPVQLTRRRQWSPATTLLALVAAAACIAFIVISAQRADANPGGGAEGALGTDVPGLLVPPALFAGLALLAGRRSVRGSRPPDVASGT